ncbi:MAG: 4Fe-4S binding protein [Richelia sp. RM2_1_2]|nr:4Fe-4S binding protein [Richelia sp. SM2_1_7]NJM22804.1 4Fe-4S binding protein [Richelia sp. SM1_7_0]NJN10772.1 4Fe-4S binding protein [Richelia sp. RM1_1_1]NJO58822.1 4Fe-4S binding protein [Richelia sp. RM2_1_2]
MLSKVSESKMHAVRWILVIGWLILIVSLFYDPITHILTDPNNLASPLRDNHECIFVQGDRCVPEKAYPIGTRIFWGMIVPAAVFIVFVFGHETWRRICPLYFLSQIPRALGLKPRLNIEKNQWLIRNHFYLQFFLLFLGLNSRILLINSTRWVLGLFLIGTILSAIIVVFLYGGRSWCHYVCPFGAVQTVFTGPRGLLGSSAHQAPPKSLTQSMCRTVDKTTGQEKSACIGCKSPCMDIDSEKAYWNQLQKPGRKFLQYGYLGLAIGYFIYYRLYSGNFDYYFSGVWTYDNSLFALWKPGFYINNQSIAIPKIAAVPLTLGLSIIICYYSCHKLEKVYRGYLKRKYPEISSQQVLHRTFSIITFLAFNAFFVYGGRPEILRLPMVLQLLFNGLIVLVSTIWLVRNWKRSAEQYQRETLTHSFRRQLQKLPLDIEQFLNGRSLDKLNADELFVLAEVLPQFSEQGRHYVYRLMVEEALTEKCISSDKSLQYLTPIRQRLGLEDKEHYQILSAISSESPELIYPQQSEKTTKTQTLPTKLKKLQEPPNSGCAETQIRRKKR